MELSSKKIEFIERILSKKIFKYRGSIVGGTNLPTDIKFKADVVGVKQYTHAGTYRDFLTLNITIIHADITSKHILGLLEERLKDNPEKDFYSFCMGLMFELYDSFFSTLELSWLKINAIYLDYEDEKTPITEGRQSRLFVRNAVKYITDLLKNNEEGDFYDYSDELNNEVGDVSFEIHLRKHKKKGFKVDAEYSQEDDSITLAIEYNPKTLESNLYEIIGLLNEYIEHELTHAKQQSEYDLPIDQPKKKFKYYSQPHELEAQKKGFIRLSKLRKLPLDIVVKTWYDTHKDFHKLSDKQVDKLINKILEY